ncbi:alpha/beta fold hydrolase [Streptomyces sp. NPDC048057]|uniref:alpha/beta fold hydrolase n=1 Tax=Streptomyces sp. NPDC048057 TaxID=3155628 RepID=UPI00341077B0
MVVRRLVPVLAAGLAASALAALTPAAAVAAPQPPPPSQAGAPFSPAWQRCGPDTPADFECATVKVPLDYRAPGGKKIDVAISRLSAADPAKRRGVLLFNPGGPGGNGLDMPLMMRELLPQSVKDRYDLIGFDPRGVGQSAPVRCGLTPEDLVMERPFKERTFARDTALARSFADKCRAKHGADLKHFTTRNTARDMDAIRAALGEQKINFFGYSYGTYLGAVYTQLFPQRADRVVLDSAVDPKRAWRADFRLWAPETEKAFKRWTRWAAERNAQYGLGATPGAVSRTFWGLVAQANRTPIKVGTTPFDGDQIRAAMRAAFFVPSRATEGVLLLRDAAAGNPTGELPVARPDEGFLSAMWAVSCGDAPWPKDPQTYRKDARRDAARFPVYGDYASHINPCAFWDDNVEPATVVDNRVGALIVHNEWDSQTPLPDGVGLREDMKGARMVFVDEGEGHGVYGSGTSTCAEDLTNAYLLTGRLPAKDTTCTPDPAGAHDRRHHTELPFLTPTARAASSAPAVR